MARRRARLASRWRRTGCATGRGSDPAGFRAAFAAFARIDPAVADAAAGWLLGAGVRPDDRVRWTGAPADACLAGLAAIAGVLTDDPAQATIVLGRPPVWPPPLRPPVAGPDGP